MAELTRRGAEVGRDGDSVRIRAPRGVLTPAVQAQVAEHKQALLALLADDTAISSPALPSAASVRRVPLSAAQHQLWLLARLDPTSCAYNIAITVRMRGRLDMTALSRSLDEIVRRHEVLRLVVEEPGISPAPGSTPESAANRAGAGIQPGELCGTIQPIASFALAPMELASMEAMDELCRRTAETPFDLARGPLFRAVLARLQHPAGPTAEDQHVLCMVAHHLVFDGWSTSVLLRELGELYAAFTAGLPSPLPLLPFQHGDYVAARHARLRPADRQAQLDFWLRQLDGAPALVPIPGDRPRPAVPGDRGERIARTIPAPLARAFHELCRAHAVTPFMALLALLDLCLARWTGHTDLWVGTPVAGRDGEAAETLIGMCVDTLLVRLDVGGNPRFAELLARARASALAAFEHPDIALADIAAARAARGERPPLIQVLLNVVSLPPPAIRLPGLETAVRETLPGARFDITLYAYIGTAAGTGELRLELAYRTDLFAAPRMAEMLAQLEHLMTQVVADPARRTSELSLVTPEAAPRLPHPWRSRHQDVIANPAADWRGAVHERFAAHARHTPQAIAVRDAAGAWTYAELDRLSTTLAARLGELGIGRLGRHTGDSRDAADVVAIWAHRSMPLAAAILGVLRAGAAFALFDPAEPPLRQAACVRQAAPRAWICLDAAGPLPAELVELAAQIPRITLPAGRAAIERVGVTRGAGLLEWQPVPADTRVLASFPATPPAAPDDLAYVAFTSGTTGAPKGILGSHLPLMHFLDWHVRTFGITASDRVAVLSGLGHDPLLRDLFTPLCIGATACMPGSETRLVPQALQAWLAAESVTIAHLTPALGRLLAAAAPHALPDMRHAFFGGDLLTYADVDAIRSRAHAATCVSFYGTTETPQAMGVTVIDTGEPRDPAAIVPLGRGIHGVELLVVNPRGELAGVAELGRIVVRTPYLARGYLDGAPDRETGFQIRRNPALDTNAPGERVFVTGDIGRYRPDGTVELAGRIDGMHKIRGYRIALAEIEHALAAHPDIAQAAVAVHMRSEAITDARATHPGMESGDPELAAYVVPAQRPWSAASLRAFLRARLPVHMIPTSFTELSALPLTPSGKVDRAALPPPQPLANSESGAAGDAPRDTLELELSRILAEVLGRDALVGVHDDFFAMGGHSLLATHVLARIRASIGVDLPMRRLFDAPTVARLAACVRTALAAAPGQQSGPTGGVPGLLLHRTQTRHNAGRIPTSFAQRRLWFLSRLDPADRSYRILHCAHIRGRLDADALDRSLAGIERRHEILRTNYVTVDGEPMQVICEPRQRVLELLSCPGSTAAERRATAERLLAQIASQPLDLEHGPIWRASLITVNAEEHFLCLCIHHIAGDGWSMSVLRRELAALYSAFCQHLPDPLPPLELQYADHAAWQRALEQSGQLDTQLAYWREALAGLVPVELPARGPRPPIKSTAGAVHMELVSPERLRALEALAQSQGTTLFITLLAGLQVLLWRYTGQSDIAIGAPVSHRSHPATENLIGLFLNTVVLRARVTGMRSFAQHLAAARETMLQAHAHQDVPFEHLVEALAPPRDRSRTPLFQVMLNILDLTDGDLTLPGLECRRLPDPEVYAKVDLALHATLRKGRLELMFVYDRVLFDAVQIQVLAGHLGEIFDAACAQPTQQLAAMSLSPAIPRPALPPLPRPGWLPFASQAAASQDAAATIPARFAAVVARHGARPAITGPGGQTLTYGELAILVKCAAKQIASAVDGHYEPARVGLLIDKGPAMVAAMLGTLAAGAAYVPLDPAFPDARLTAIIADAAITALVIASNPNGTSMSDMHARAHRLAPPGCPIIDITDSADTAVYADTAPMQAQPDALAYLLYTSGSTGVPKGVMQSHRNVLGHIGTYVDALAITPDDRLSLLSTYAFDAAVMDIYGAVLTGACLCLVDTSGDSLRTLAQEIAAQRITILHATPTVYRYLLSSLPAGDRDTLSCVRRVVLGGEEAHARDVLATWPHVGEECIIVNGLGPTESTLALQAFIDRHTPLARPSLPVGRAVASMEVELINPAGPQQAIYGTGEIVIRGPHVALGYWRRPELTAAAFAQSGPDQRSYRTGDWGRILPDGIIEFVGRRDQQIKIRGHRIELGEIEASLEANPNVARAAVIAQREAEHADPRLIAYVMPVTGATITEAALRAHLAASLPSWMMPAAVLSMDELPATPTGKLDRRALASMPVDRLPPRTTTPPRDALEAALAALWQDVLGTGPVGVDEDFFALGGHSLLAVRLLERMRRQFGCDIVLAELFQGATVARLAARIRDGRISTNQDEPPHLGASVISLRQAHPPSSPLASQRAQYWGSGVPALLLVAPPGARADICFSPLARHLGMERRALGVEVPALGLPGGPATVEDAAALACTALPAHVPASDARGPWLLCGYSHGGAVAVAMAQNLRAQGAQVPTLVLLDAPAPALLRAAAAQPGERQPAEWLASFAAQLWLRAKTNERISTTRVRNELLSAANLDELFARARHTGALADDISRAELEHAFAEHRRQRLGNARAIASFAPHASEMPRAVLLRARERAHALPDPTLGWRALGLRVEVHEVPGDHHSMLEEPCVQALASALHDVLERDIATKSSTSGLARHL